MLSAQIQALAATDRLGGVARVQLTKSKCPGCEQVKKTLFRVVVQQLIESPIRAGMSKVQASCLQQCDATALHPQLWIHSDCGRQPIS